MSDSVKISGVVERKGERATSAGTTYSITVDNVNYGFYKTVPKCSEGDYVEFYAKQNGNYWNADAKTLKLIDRPASPPKPQPAAKGAWVPDKDRQDSIIYQSARKDALEFVQVLLTAGILDLGKSKTAAGKIEVAEIYLDKYTQRFFEDTKNLGHKDEEVAEKREVEEDFHNDEIPF